MVQQAFEFPDSFEPSTKEVSPPIDTAKTATAIAAAADAQVLTRSGSTERDPRETAWGDLGGHRSPHTTDASHLTLI